MNRTIARLFSVGLLAAVLCPIQENWKTTKRDDFPFSYYPMFTQKRDAFTNVTFARVLTERGAMRLHYSFLGSGGFNQSRKQIRHAVLGSQQTAKDYCISILRRVQPQMEPGAPFQVQILTARFVRDDYFTGRSSKPTNVVLHTECSVTWDEDG